MKKTIQYILMSVALAATASCSNEMDKALQPADNCTLKFIVGDFPIFCESGQTRAVGTADPGKSQWEPDDEILVIFNSPKFGTQSVTLTYDQYTWTPQHVEFKSLQEETFTVTAIYSPLYELVDDRLQLKEGKLLGTDEYIEFDIKMYDDVTINLIFDDYRYSRLRIAGEANQTLTVATTDFTPAGGTEGDYEYTLTTNTDGNAFLYGSFVTGSEVTVSQDATELRTYEFDEDTYEGYSYVLDVNGN